MATRMTAAELVNSQNRKSKPRDIEGPIHRSILAHLRLVLPKGSIVHHSPNAIGLSGIQVMKQIARDKAMGTVKGFPDLLCLLPGPRVWAFEVKAPGNHPDKDQRELHETMRAQGIRVAVVRSIKDVDEAVAQWTVEGTGQWGMQK
ncbi:VRR-NUC domain-containing protein [Paracoccus fontiphilus]|uniref:VRR-NUC domain-containing protein n=1 Tax=Paracoccus fontiphilus TaxID=1815556 RepID=A0ABV7IF73_9RHOB|nr:VRR-NUC domain-containing protein [Paracoccus fontiphilus]